MKRISKFIVLLSICLLAKNSSFSNKEQKEVLEFFDSRISKAISAINTNQSEKKVCIDYSKFKKLNKNDVNFAIAYSLKKNAYKYSIEREKKLLYFLKEAIVYKKRHNLDYSHEVGILSNFDFTPISWNTFMEDKKRYEKLPKEIRQYLDTLFKGENIDMSFLLKQTDMFNHNKKYEDVLQYCRYKKY